MSRVTVLMILGLIVAASPYLGLPLSTLALVLPVLGLSIAAIALTIKMRARAQAPEAISYDVQEA